MARPGILYVTLHPLPPISLKEWEDWYNNEHGPIRMQLPFIATGTRYKAVDGFPPDWMAYYDVTDLNQMKTAAYTSLMANPSPREEHVLSHKYQGNRNFADLQISIGEVGPDRKPDVCIVLEMTMRNPQPGQEEDIHRWYVDEHIPLLEKIPGWLRSRRWKDAPEWQEPGAPIHYIAMHEFRKEHGIGGPEFLHATTTPWRQKVMGGVEFHRRIFNLHYEFGPLPRDLTHLPDSQKHIESTYSTRDGQKIKYRLEGSKNPNAPVVVFVNSILTTWTIWDQFVEKFLLLHPQYRIVRSDLRGRAALGPNTISDITLDVLSADVADLLDGLRVEKAHAVIGVSIGGATTLNFALKYPHRLNRYIACDFTGTSFPNAAQLWGDRISLGEKDFPALAKATTERWTLPENHGTDAAKYVTKMVQENDWNGFKQSVRALYNYDLDTPLSTSKVPGLLLAGEGDAIVPKVMEEMSKKGSNAKFVAVKGAGHLPMVENPQGFLEAVEEDWRAW